MKLRPHCLENLSLLSKFYEIYIFTNGSEEYANAVMDLMDPNADIFCGNLSRKHCLKTNKGLFIKDLRIFANKSLKNVLIIDKFIHSFAFQIDNGIPLLPWMDDDSDCELTYLSKYLISLTQYNDLRKANKHFLKLSEIANKCSNN